MKELSMEQKAQRYDEIIEGIQEILSSGQDSIKMSRLQLRLQGIFPELREEFEDEKIRKSIIRCVKGSMPDNDFRKKYIAWLEKQGKNLNMAKSPQLGEQKSANNNEPKFHKGEWIVFNGLTLYVKEVVKGFYRTISKGGITNSYDWDIDNVARLWTIQDAKEGDVLYSPCLSLLWIFKSKDTVYCGCNLNYNDGAFCGEGYFERPTDAIPATKEQRDTLFAKMKEADYEWSEETHELKKIEAEEYNGEDYGIDSLWHAKNILEKTLGKVDGYQTDDGILEHKCAIAAVNKLYKQKPSWSKEDEKERKRVVGLLEGWLSTFKETYYAEDCKCGIEWLKSLKDRVGCETDCTTTKEWSEEDEKLTNSIEAWLDTLCDYLKDSSPERVEDVKDVMGQFKSLKQRHTWKPSEEQMKALADALSLAKNCGEEGAFDLRTLHEQLEKL